MLNRDFNAQIDMSDFEGKQPQEVETARSSRALAALAVRGLTGWEDKDCVKCVIDGRRDQGIDAIAISETSREIWLVQAKYSSKGTAGVGKDAARALIQGWRLIDNSNFDRLNERAQRFEDRLRAVLRDPHARVHLVMAVTGPGGLSEEVRETFEDELAEANGHGLTLDYRVLNTESLWQQIRVEEAPPEVEIEARMRKWIHVDVPVSMYQGIVPASQVAEWFGTAGQHLFQQNIRYALGVNEVNSGIVETAVNNPEYFLCFHNGITVICDSLETEFPGRRRPDEPVILKLRGASVVNGAQSVTSLHHALLESPEALEDADVSVHVICTNGDSPELPSRITTTRNRQNQVEERDFVALDRTQTYIREEFALVLDKTYTYKRGEADPSPDQGCSVTQAAVALACAHPNTKLTVRAKQNVDTLWERGSDGAYDLLFKEQPSASMIWGMVRLHRATVARVHEVAKKYKGRAADVADRGDFLIAHLVSQIIDRKGMDDVEYGWDGVLARVPALVDTVFPWLVHHVDLAFGPDSKKSLTRTLSDPLRCRLLSDAVLRDVRAGGESPKVPDDYLRQAQQRASRKLRRPNSVTILKDSGALVNGTPLRFEPANTNERQALSEWLAKDPARVEASWTGNRKYPLLWAADGRNYSPSGLVMHMYGLVGWENAPLAVQGPSRWYIDGVSMADLAERLYADMGDES
ncbi:AIPR family protein [Nocardiopsis sp. FR4]|uniref:AIPR family protein n=1 Tax=Nocardiopsis sp. FR4 TaxID=2605985 RepID=UPI001F3AC1B8|nr:AIPR family protein [Nocardiopsis sp. FR4]